MKRVLAVMLSTLMALALMALTLPAAATLPSAFPTSSTTAVLPPPVHAITVGGEGVVSYPGFSPGIARYGITTTSGTAGVVSVTATTDDPAGRVLMNGQPVPGGTRTFSGLVPGDEIAVFFEDSAGTSRHSYIYLPAGFPVLERTTPAPTAGSIAPGLLLLTLAKWVAPSPFFSTGVDPNGVPAFVDPGVFGMDLKRQPSGHLTVSRLTQEPGRTGEDLVVLDATRNVVERRRTVGLVDTDGHDSILLPDGTLWLMAYEPRNPDGTGLVDAVIQRIEPNGTVGFEWDSEDYVADAVLPDDDDYAHINSFDVMQDGDLLVSFRHFSSVFKIATTEHDGFAVGDVVWKLGGRDSDFTFPLGDVGPCAQHTASELPNGNILMFDNGSWSPGPGNTALCVDPADPNGPAVQRVQTRIVEFGLDHVNGTASVVSSYEPPGWFAIFAGSSERLGNGNTLIGWAEETNALASEIGADNSLLWELRDAQPANQGRYFTYRATKSVVPDATAPQVAVTSPADGATYVEGTTVTPAFECEDRGGSSLMSCTAPTTIDTSSPGQRSFTVTGVDGAGATTTVTRSYRVLAATQPDAAIKARGSGDYVGQDEYGAAPTQQARSRLFRTGDRAKAVVRLQNDGALPTRIFFQVRGRNRGFGLSGRHLDGGISPMLQPGESWTFKLRVVRRSKADAGDRLVVRIVSSSEQTPSRTDAVSWRIRATG